MQCQCESRWEELTEYIRSVYDPEHPQSALIAILHEAQAREGYLSNEVMEHIAQVTEVPAAEVYGVATFYGYFKLQPRGRHQISVCMGTACYIKGAAKILEIIEDEIDIRPGETSEDGQFSLDETRCIGACGLAPVLLVDDQVYGRVEPEQARAIMAELRAAADPT